VNYDLRIEDVVDYRYGVIRGFKGWIIYELTYPKLKKYLSRIFGPTQYMGIGRLRKIGLGQIMIKKVIVRE